MSYFGAYFGGEPETVAAPTPTSPPAVAAAIETTSDEYHDHVTLAIERLSEQFKRKNT